MNNISEIQVVKVKETHTVFYTLEPGETASNALSILSSTEHTRVPFNSLKTYSEALEILTINIDSPLLCQDYSDMINFNSK
jgi:hypothetical protein